MIFRSVAGLFTPGHGALGGLLLGVASVAQLVLTGRVLGCSGTIKGVFMRVHGRWRNAMVVGLAGAAIPLALLMPGNFAAMPATYSYARAAIGGLLVGIGTGLGNGCTSGHGICGNARLSPRSMVFTLTFMAAGSVAAVVSKAAAAAGIVNKAASLSLPSAPVVALSLGIAAAATVVFSAIGFIGSKTKGPNPNLEMLTSGLVGAVFAVGLALSGMTLPSKIIAFLTPASSWDASMITVMAAALATAMPAYQYINAQLKRGSAASLAGRGKSGGAGKSGGSGGALHTVPSMKLGSNFFEASPVKPGLVPSFSLPTSSDIDARLLLGGVLFGAGWGISGICPGPAVVAFVGSAALRLKAMLLGKTLSVGAACMCSKVGTYIATMLLGMVLEQRLLQDTAPSRA